MENLKKLPKSARGASAIAQAMSGPPSGLAPGPLVVGFSGGLDSTVLLHALASEVSQSPRWQGFSLYALHVNHRLQPAAAAMERHCRAFCAQHRLPLVVRRPKIAASEISALGVEAAARKARRDSLGLEANRRKAQAVVLAHHQDDLVETTLLQWVRGAGLEGLTAMLPLGQSAIGLIWRPLLACEKTAVLAYAQANGLSWIEDPTNALPEFDRNRLRQEVLPVLRAMRSGAIGAMARSIGHLQEARGLLEDMTRHDMDCCSVGPGNRLSLSSLRLLGRQRMARVLRAWMAAHGHTMPPSRRLEEFCRQILSAGAESRAQLTVAPAVAGESGGFRVWLRAGFLHIERS